MAEPFGTIASVGELVANACKVTQSLVDTVERYKDRDKTLRRLQDDLEDHQRILRSLETEAIVASPVFSLLESPIRRCGQLCRDFEHAMKQFASKAKMGFRDWTKMEFMRGDINEFMETLSSYKSTILVGLGYITMQSSKLTQDLLEKFGEEIKDTVYSLKMLSNRVDERLAHLPTEDSRDPGGSVDLRDEKAVTRKCLQICEDAKVYLESLAEREPSDQSSIDATAITAAHSTTAFAAQLLTRRALDQQRQSLAETIGQLRERLHMLDPDGSTERDQERQYLQEMFETSKRCLDMCNKASDEVSNRKTYQVGEAIADGESDQVLVSTLADLYDVRKAVSKDKSAQLLGMMTDESLQKISADRYNSRFGKATDREAKINNVSVPPPALQRKNGTPPQDRAGQGSTKTDVDQGRSKPTANTNRKRTEES